MSSMTANAVIIRYENRDYWVIRLRNMVDFYEKRDAEIRNSWLNWLSDYEERYKNGSWFYRLLHEHPSEKRSKWPYRTFSPAERLKKILRVVSAPNWSEYHLSEVDFDWIANWAPNQKAVTNRDVERYDAAVNLANTRMTF